MASAQKDTSYTEKKETNELEESQIIGVSYDNYTIYENLLGKIKNLTEVDRIHLGIPKRRFYQLKKQNKSFKRIGKVLRRIIKYNLKDMQPQNIEGGKL
ncbi:MAG: hypothetical protein ACP5U0_08970 [Caldisphaera sp.]